MTAAEKKKFNLRVAQLTSNLEKDIANLFSKSVSTLNEEALAVSENLIMEMSDKVLKSVNAIFQDYAHADYAHYKLFDVEERIRYAFNYAPDKIDPKRSSRLVKHRDSLLRICDYHLGQLINSLERTFENDRNIEISAKGSGD